MATELSALLRRALSPSPWDLGNDMLYDLCKTNPDHTEIGAVVAKIWLIGRSYAAAIERRRNKGKDELNDDFYVRTVAPAIIDSEIDAWLSKARQCARNESDAPAVLLEVHASTTQLFKQISRQDKRSLASKYLHFHVPDVFYIYDKRAVEAMSHLASITGRATKKTTTSADNEYRKFVEKCFRLKRHVKDQLNLDLTCRQLDKLLLEVHAS